MLTLSVPHEITSKRIADLVTAGLEGGVSCWMNSFHLRSEPCQDGSGDIWYARGVTYEDPSLKIECLCLDDDDDGDETQKVLIQAGRFKWALEKMAKEYPYHFTNFIQENEDADTGDVFLQILVLGDVIYG